MALVQLADLTWDDLFVRSLPGDQSGRNSSRQTPEACYATVTPTPVAAPRLLAWSPEAAELLGLAKPGGDASLQRSADILGGNHVLPRMKPYAAAYGGHQFGTWAGQLGDGRAMTLGEVIAPGGQRWDVQLKGAGPTPYSRRSDGRAVLRSSIREFLCSEAMFHLGVPTTRALSLVATGDQVVRDMFYDGRPRAEPGAIVCRLAPTFLRFGSFELLSWREDHDGLQKLVSFAIATHFPELGLEVGHKLGADELPPALVARWFAEISRRTAVMISHWMRVGFVHGVMNTDNMSILGLTIDYGPYGWLEPFDPNFTPNTTDAANGRYRFGMQPGIAQWNLAHLARALAPLCPTTRDKEALAAGLDVYRTTFERTYSEMMRGKLGLSATASETSTAGELEDGLLVNDLLALLAAEETDLTLFFRGLAEVPIASAAIDDDVLAPLVPSFYAPANPARRAQLLAWLHRYRPRAAREPGGDAVRQQRMAAHNPVFVLRNYLVQQAIERTETALAAGPREGDASDIEGLTEGPIEGLLQAARAPYREGPEHAGLLGKRPDWARDAPGCSALSCSS
jgi:serine/tyrosine/threonine adenylyltransferase